MKDQTKKRLLLLFSLVAIISICMICYLNFYSKNSESFDLDAIHPAAIIPTK